MLSTELSNLLSLGETSFGINFDFPCCAQSKPAQCSNQSLVMLQFPVHKIQEEKVEIIPNYL